MTFADLTFPKALGSFSRTTCFMGNTAPSIPLATSPRQSPAAFGPIQYRQPQTHSDSPESFKPTNKGSETEERDSQTVVIRSLPLRQLRVVELVAAGWCNKEIGVKLGISAHTVDWHLRQLFTRFGTHCRSALVYRWLEWSGERGGGSRRATPRERVGYPTCIKVVKG